MTRKIISTIIFTLLLISMLTLAFNVPSVKATGTIYIRADGSIDPPTAPIQRNDDVYTLTDNITSDAHGIVVQRSSIIIDGNGYTLQGPGSSSGWVGLDLSLVDRVTIRNTNIEAYQCGVLVYRSSYDIISSNNNITRNHYGIKVSTASSSNVILGNNVTDNDTIGLYLTSLSTNSSIVGNHISANHDFGIQLGQSSNNTIYGNSIVNQKYGIYFTDSSSIIVKNNNIADNSQYGVYNGPGCSNNRVFGNEIVNNGIGVELDGRSRGVNNMVYGNNITGNTGHGVSLYNCSNCRVYGNNITANNADGVDCTQSSINNSIIGNRITANYNGIYFGDSNNNTAFGNNITANSYCGVLLARSNNTVVRGNDITANNYYGIELGWSSNNNSISGNSITANTWDGVLLSQSSNNTIYDNGVTSNCWGVDLEWSNNNTFYGNSITANTVGVYFYYSSNNSRLYHNSFVNNTYQAAQGYGLSLNVWDNGFPSGGNYWSDYATRYPSALEIDDSRIWDTPYVIDVYNQDNYPLMGSWTENGENVTVVPALGVSLTFANVTSEGITTVNETQSGPTPFPDYKIEGQYFDISTTASYSGNITIRLTYDDTNMTQQEEESLRLMRWNETSQQWEDITTCVGMQNNVIYGETNHLSIFAVHSLLIHDLSIFSVHTLKTIIGRGYTLNIDVDVRNEGDFEETFDATVDLVAGQISYLSIFSVHIVSQNTMTLHFTWNTASNAIDTYNIVAHISQVPYEIDTADNTYSDGTVTVTIPGDVTGDLYVNIKDAAQIGANWGKTVPPAPANVDINGDGIINIKDAALVGANWGKHA